MTSLFEVDYHDEQHVHRAARKTVVAAAARVEQAYGPWLRQDPVARLAHLKEEIAGIVGQVCDEHGNMIPAHTVVAAIEANYRPQQPSTFERVASVEHEAARMPRMCPFHKDVTEISLNAGDPAAGFSAMAQHWGGDRHCEGEGYKGESCKFKPQMTTQSWWDERAEKAEQRKKERAEQAELDAQQQAEQAEAEKEFAEPLEQETEVPSDNDNVVELRPEQPEPDELGSQPPTQPSPESEVPMSMAAKTATETTGLGKPAPKMDKSKWSPRAPEGLDDPDGRHPTEHKDVVEPIKVKNNDIVHPGNYEEIGKQVTQRQDVMKEFDVSRSDQGGAWTEGPKTAISAADDVNRNPIIDMVNEEYDGFTPQHEVDQAIVAHKRR